jgi:hypothetical protein
LLGENSKTRGKRLKLRKDFVSAILEEITIKEDKARKLAEAREHLIPSGSKVLCSFNWGLLLILSDGVLVIAPSITSEKAEFIPHQDLEGVAVGQTFGTLEHTLTIEPLKQRTTSILKTEKNSRITARHRSLKLVSKAKKFVMEGIASSEKTSPPRGPLGANI